VARLNTEVRAILASPEVVERFTAQGMKARSSTPEELAARVARDLALWKSVIAAAGIKPE
jgi:tripartite-type tricarboxylate transporter receptor subunit TctC